MTAYNESTRCITMLAEADLSDKQFYAVKNGAADKGMVLAGAGDAAVGILHSEPGDGESGAVCIEGISQAIYGGSVVPGDALAANAAGRLVRATAGQNIVAFAQETGSAGEIHAVRVNSAGGKAV